MSFRQVLVPLILLWILLCALPAAAVDWQPVSPEELAMKDNPAEPGAHAMILYRDVVRDDLEAWGTEYIRIKIFTEEGRKWGNVEVRAPRVAGFRATDFKGRTIHPDGSIVDWQGKVLEKLIVKNKQLKYYAYTFSLPDVQRGSIIEFRYRIGWERHWIFGEYWDVQRELFTRHAHFFLRQYQSDYWNIKLNWLTRQLPSTLALKPDGRGHVELDLKDIPGFREEPYMPPEALYKMRVDFYYSLRPLTKDPADFWRAEGKDWNGEVEKVVGNPAAVQDVVAATVSPADPPELKLRKLYERAQKLRNTSFEARKTEQELKRENVKQKPNAGEILKRGFGDSGEINRVFVALARAAGIETSVVRAAPRDEDFFQPIHEDRNKLGAELALARLPGGEMYLAPGRPTCPFGLLPWDVTGVTALRLDRSGGAFVTTPHAVSNDAQVQRKATLQLSEDGSLSGKLQLIFSGQEALDRRLDGLDTDDAGRRKLIKDEISSWLPDNSTVEVTKVSAWGNGEEPLTVEATVNIPELAAMTGRRMLLPEGIFQVREKYPLQASQRQYPVYFRYPYRENDDVLIQLPPGYRLENLPVPRQATPNYGQYKMFAMREGSSVHLQRSFGVERILFKAENYDVLRDFFDLVRAGDEDRMVLQTAAQ